MKRFIAPFGLGTLRWLTAVIVSLFLLGFEYLRHFAYPELLHTIPLYFLSVGVVFTFILAFNQFVFSLLEDMQRNLARQTSYLNHLIDDSGNAIISTDRAGKIQTWNHAAEEIYGWSSAEAVGQIIPMVPEPLRADAQELLAHIWRGETVRNLETTRLRKGGQLIPVMVTGSPVLDSDGHVVAIIGISTDLRERKRLEQELLARQRETAVLEERERMARELHDDLGQVLGFINTQAQSARTLLIRGRTADAGAQLKRLVEVAQDAHADVRDYVLGLRSGGLDGSALMPALRAYVLRFAQVSAIPTTFDAAPALDRLEFEPGAGAQLIRVVQEALTNARRHSGAAHITIAMSATPAEARIEIADDGKGFDVRCAPADGRPHYGQRIMRERMAEIGGQLEVQSAPGQGTRVSIIAPLRHLEAVAV